MAVAELGFRNPILGTFLAGCATARSGATSILRVSVTRHPTVLYPIIVSSHRPPADLLLSL